MTPEKTESRGTRREMWIGFGFGTALSISLTTIIGIFSLLNFQSATRSIGTPSDEVIMAPFNFDGRRLLSIGLEEVPEERRSEVLGAFWEQLQEETARYAEGDVTLVELPDYGPRKSHGRIKLHTDTIPESPFELLVHFVWPEPFDSRDRERMDVMFWVGVPQADDDLIHNNERRFRDQAWPKLRGALRFAAKSVLDRSEASDDASERDSTKTWFRSLRIRVGRERVLPTDPQLPVDEK